MDLFNRIMIAINLLNGLVLLFLVVFQKRYFARNSINLVLYWVILSLCNVLALTEQVLR